MTQLEKEVNVSKFTRPAASRRKFWFVPIFLTLVLASGVAVANLVKSYVDPASTEIVAFPASESASRKQATVVFAGPVEVPVWKTIDVGVYHDADTVREALHSAPYYFHVDAWADEILSRTEFSQADTKLNLVVTTASALGFGEEGASLKDIYARASQLGLSLCPAEVGPILRLDYVDQQLGEYLHIAMEPLARFDGKPTAFTVAKGLKGWLLLGDDVRGDRVIAGDVQLVFVTAPSLLPTTVTSSAFAPDIAISGRDRHLAAVLPRLAADHPGGNGATITLDSVRALGLNDPTISTFTVDLAPGGSAIFHRKPSSGYVLVHVLSGAIHAQARHAGLGTYHVSETWVEPALANDITVANANTTEPARVFVVVVTGEDKPQRSENAD